MKTFLALYLTPASVLEDWMQTPEAERKESEAKMQADWNAWMQIHGAHIKETRGAGKTKRVSSDGIVDVKNDVMLYSIVEAETHEAAAAIFKDHPHFQIPQATIDVMVANELPM
jgi:hypothetical protein